MAWFKRKARAEDALVHEPERRQGLVGEVVQRQQLHEKLQVNDILQVEDQLWDMRREKGRRGSLDLTQQKAPGFSSLLEGGSEAPPRVGPGGLPQRIHRPTPLGLRPGSRVQRARAVASRRSSLPVRPRPASLATDVDVDSGRSDNWSLSPLVQGDSGARKTERKGRLRRLSLSTDVRALSHLAQLHDGHNDELTRLGIRKDQTEYAAQGEEPPEPTKRMTVRRPSVQILLAEATVEYPINTKRTEPLEAPVQEETGQVQEEGEGFLELLVAQYGQKMADAFRLCDRDGDLVRIPSNYMIREGLVSFLARI